MLLQHAVELNLRPSTICCVDEVFLLECRTVVTTAEKGRVGVGFLMPVWVQVS